MRIFILLILLPFVALVKTQEEKETLGLSALSSSEIFSLANEEDEKWKTPMSSTITSTTTTSASKKKNRSKKQSRKKLEDNLMTRELSQSTIKNIVTSAATPGFETDSVTDIENMLNLKEIKFETNIALNSTIPLTTTTFNTALINLAKSKPKKSKKHLKKENKLFLTTKSLIFSQKTTSKYQVAEAKETDNRKKRNVNNNEKLKSEKKKQGRLERQKRNKINHEKKVAKKRNDDTVRKLETSLNGPIERVKISKSIDVPYERSKRAAKKESTTKLPLAKNFEETAPPDQGAQVVAELQFEDEDALQKLLLKKKIIAGEIPANSAHNEPKKHIGGNVRGGVVSFEEALQITVPYDAETE